MKKKIFSVIFSIFLIFTCCAPAFAYEPSGFTINAKNALLVSLDTGEVLFEKGADEKVYPASITKIMTVTLMLESEKYNPDAKIAMSEEVLKLISGTGSSVSGLKAGEEISQLDLLYTVLMASFGDCAYLAAIYYGETLEGFVDMMNAKAAELGLNGTHYANPVGLHDEQNYTTARDTYVLTRYALKNSTFKTACETVRYTLAATNFSPARTLSTTNFLQDSTTNYYYTYAKGVKTGYTDEAGRCLVSTASSNGYNYICILFGCTPNAGTRYEFIDSKNLYRWAFTTFEFKTVAEEKSPVCEIPVELSFETDFIPLYVENGFVSVMPKDADESTISIVPKLSGKSADAPVKKGDILGTADIVYAEKVIGTVNLVSGQNVKRNTLLFIVREIKNVLSSIYMKLIYAAAAIAVLIFIILVIKMNWGRKRRKVKYIPYNENKH